MLYEYVIRYPWLVFIATVIFLTIILLLMRKKLEAISKRQKSELGPKLYTVMLSGFCVSMILNMMRFPPSDQWLDRWFICSVFIFVISILVEINRAYIKLYNKAQHLMKNSKDMEGQHHLSGAPPRDDST